MIRTKSKKSTARSPGLVGPSAKGLESIICSTTRLSSRALILEITLILLDTSLFKARGACRPRRQRHWNYAGKKYTREAHRKENMLTVLYSFYSSASRVQVPIENLLQ